MPFEGFVQPTKNYFPVPNNWIDICAHIRDISELKVIQYVIRHTWGFREYGICKTISVDEFMHGRRRQNQTRMDCGTGLSEQGVRNGLKKAIKDGYLICEVDPSDTGRIKKSYALKMHTQVQTLDPPQTLDPVQSLESKVQTLDPQVQSLGVRGINFVPRTEKDTLERHLEKDTLERQEDITISARAGNGKPALIHLEVEKKRRETDPHMPVIRISSHSQGLSEMSKEEEEEEPTISAKGHVHESTASARAALPCIEHHLLGIEHHLLAGYGESSQQEASATSEHITLQQPPDAGQAASAPAAPTALGVSSPPPTSGVQQGAADHTPPQPRLKKTVIVKDTAGPPAFPSESDAWGTTTCLRLFDFWRGAPLCDLGQLKYASSCAKKLAETYNRKQVVIVRTAMNNQKFWKEQGGADVCDVARHMQKELNKLKMPVAAPAQQQSPDQSRPTLEEVECIDPTWCVYQRPGDTQEWILWQGELLTEDEANDRGYAGGGGLYNQTQYA